MFSASEIETAQERLVDDKLSPLDVSLLSSIFRKIFADLEVQYNYQFESKLSELEDSSASFSCAIISCCMIKMEELGFGVAELVETSKSAIRYREQDDYLQYVLIAFSKIYPIPAEFAQYDMKRSILRASISSGRFRTSNQFATQRT